MLSAVKSNLRDLKKAGNKKQSRPERLLLIYKFVIQYIPIYTFLPRLTSCPKSA